MATIVNNPPGESTSWGGGMSFLLGVILLIVFLAILFMYILPAVGFNLGGTQINVPRDFNVNIRSQ